MTMSKPLSQP